ESHLGATTTNGDGFGIGWYGEGVQPALFKSIQPAWNDRNLREISGQIRTPLFFAHVRASTGSPVQRSNCHPFRHGRWLWMHNGILEGHREMRRDLMTAMSPELFPELEGTTDSEVLFYLALTFGLTDDPIAGVARAVGFVEDVGRAHGVEHPVQMTVATTDGGTIWIYPYSTEHRSRSLFFSTDMDKLKALHPEVEALRRRGGLTRFEGPEPLRALPDAWHEVPESSVGVIRAGAEEIRPFEPLSPV